MTNRFCGWLDAALFLFALLFSFFSCAQKTPLVIAFEEQEGFEREKEFLITAQNNDGGIEFISAQEPPDILISFVADWENSVHENDAARDSLIIVSREWFVPRRDALEPRNETTFSACLEGSEDLMPLAELDAPFVALKVDGMDVANSAYPLVWSVSAQFRLTEKTPRAAWFFGTKRAKKRAERVNEKIALFTEHIKNAKNPLIESTPKLFWIASGGDVMLERGALDILLKEGAKGIFGETAALLQNADVAVINLEGVVSARGTKTPKSYNFRFAPSAVRALKEAGIDAVLHANNHVFDYGIDAFKDSLGFLAQEGIGALGAGNNEAQAASAFVKVSPNTDVHLFGIASFPREKNGWDGAATAATPERAGMLFANTRGVELLKANFSDAFDIVFFHGGEEWSTRPDSRTRSLYTELIESGADLVIGTHPHVTQGFEWINGKAVFWSLGNFVFGGMDGTPGGEQGLFINLGYEGKKLVYLEPSPVTLKGNRAVVSPQKELETFYARSKELIAEE